MDTSPFDNLTRVLGTRRTVLSLLGGLATLAAAGTHPTRAKRHKKHKKPCKSPKQKCGGTCLAVLTDNDNCGACGNRCANGQACKNGSCKGSTTPQGCQPGACCEDNQICNGDGRCRDGACQPKPTCQPNGATFLATSGLVCCSENFSSNAGATGVETTCLPGELGNACLTTGDCRSGACVGYQCTGCSAGEGVCDGYCVSLTSQSNCGTCGVLCGRSEFCAAGCQERYVFESNSPTASAARVLVEPDAFFVADNRNDCVRQYSSGGVLQYTYGVCGTNGTDNQHLWRPQGVVTTGNLVLIADGINSRFQIYQRGGGVLGSFGTKGTGPYQFDVVSDIALDADGNIYVADSNNCRIQKYNSSGQYLMTFGAGYGFDNTHLQFPEGICLDRRGNLYVADKWNSRVQKFDSDGNYLQTFGVQGHGPGQFSFPSGCVVASNGDLFVADYINNSVQQFTSRGVLVRSFDDTAWDIPFGVTLDAHENLYVADETLGLVRYHLAADSPS